MKQIARFFWWEFKRACQMDATNKELGKDTPYVREALRWTDKFKQGLSKNKQNEFDKEWNKCEEYLDRWNNANPKQLKTMKPPSEELL